MKAILDLVGEELARAKIPYLVVGGCAVNMHGYSRQTDDVDILIEEKFADAASACLIRHGYTEHRYDTRFSRLVPSNPLLVIVDFLYVDGPTFAKMLAASTPVKHGSHEHQIPSAEHLIAMKLHALAQGREQRRSKDAQDIIELARIARMEINSPAFETLCLKFANPSVLGYLRALTSHLP